MAARLPRRHQICKRRFVSALIELFSSLFLLIGAGSPF